MSLLKLILFTDSSESSKEDAVPRSTVASPLMVFEGRWGGLKMRDGGRLFFSPPTPCRHPRGVYNGAEPPMSLKLLIFGTRPECAESDWESRGLAVWAPANVSRLVQRECWCLCVEAYRRSIRLQPSVNIAGKCYSLSGWSTPVTLCDFTDNSVHVGAQGCKTVIWPRVS